MNECELNKFICNFNSDFDLETVSKISKNPKKIR